MTIRLAIIDDYEVVVRGLAFMLEPYRDEIEVVELDTQLPVQKPVDIALYDTFAQAQGNGKAVADLVRDPQVGRVVVYSWNIEDRLVEGALETGAAAYLSKSLSAEELVAALKDVQSGVQVVPSAATNGAPDAAGDWPGREHGLTAREAEVIALITQGLSNAEIAERASLSINSVKSYIRTSYRKMGVTSRTNAVLWGLDHGFNPGRMRIQQRAGLS
jgi:DNA-binding NarL/FixJ family response regulator